MKLNKERKEFILQTMKKVWDDYRVRGEHLTSEEGPSLNDYYLTFIKADKKVKNPEKILKDWFYKGIEYPELDFIHKSCPMYLADSSEDIILLPWIKEHKKYF